MHNQRQPSVRPLEIAFDHFNQELFDGILKRPILKVKSIKALGHFAFEGCRGTTEDTICIDLHHFKEHSQDRVLSTLVHEMCHQWQSNHGKMGRRSGYHNLQWADKMEECGLMASTTGKPGGKRNGPRVSHYIIPGGVFEQACSRLPEGFALYQTPPLVKAKAKTKVKAKTVTVTKPPVPSPVKAKAKTVTKPPPPEPSPVAPVSTRPHKQRRQKRRLTLVQKSSLVIKHIFQVILDQPVLAVLIVIAFLVVVT